MRKLLAFVVLLLAAAAALGVTISGGGGGGTVSGDIQVTSVTDGSADPADAGFIRCGNAVDCIAVEHNPAGTDLTIQVDSSNRWRTYDGTSYVYINSGGNVDLSAGKGIRNSAGGLGAEALVGAAGQITLGAQVPGAADNITIAPGLKTLTDNTPTIFTKVAVASGSQTGGTVYYSVIDTTTGGSITGVVPFSVINVGGTITCAIKATDTDQQTLGGAAGFTLTGMTCADATANVLNLLANAKTTGGTDVLKIRYWVAMNGLFVQTPQ